MDSRRFVFVSSTKRISGVQDNDPRPISSPYATPNIRMSFDSEGLGIPKALLSNYPKLMAELSLRNEEISLPQTPLDVGHVLVHFLHTGTYQCLKPKGMSIREKCASELTTSVGVYSLAKKYALSLLEELAKDEMERLGDQLDFPLVVDIVQKASYYPTANENWFQNYFKRRLRRLWEDPSGALQGNAFQSRPTTVTMSQLLLRAVLELACEDKEAQSENMGVPAIEPRASSVAETPRPLMLAGVEAYPASEVAVETKSKPAEKPESELKMAADARSRKVGSEYGPNHSPGPVPPSSEVEHDFWQPMKNGTKKKKEEQAEKSNNHAIISKKDGCSL